jgi:hypothetical protein
MSLNDKFNDQSGQDVLLNSHQVNGSLKQPRFSSYMTSIFRILAWTLSDLFSGGCFAVILPVSVCVSNKYNLSWNLQHELEVIQFVSNDSMLERFKPTCMQDSLDFS